MVLVHLHRFPNKQNHPRAIRPNETVGGEHPRTILSNKIVGAVPMCPPERPHSGVSIPKIHTLCAGNLMTDAPLQGDTGGHIGTAPTKLHHIFPHNPTQTKEPFTCNPPKGNQPSMCNPPLPISIKPCGVPLPHRGYTFDSAGLASATQPTLGNNASEEATPLGVVLSFIAHHYHTQRMDYSQMISPYEN